jgi:precorrin-2 dehydrogenase/sirohydrochlorin ferrochelatase
MVAARKVSALLRTGARIVVVSKKTDEALLNICKSSNVVLVRSSYSKDYLCGAVLVIAATDDTRVNNQIYKDCQKLEILCNVVDQPQLCDFFVPAVVKRGDLQISISTDGNCPAYSGHVRKKLEEIFTEEHGEFVNELEKVRKRIINEVPKASSRNAILGELVADKSFEYFKQNGQTEWHSQAEKIINKHTAKI